MRILGLIAAAFALTAGCVQLDEPGPESSPYSEPVAMSYLPAQCLGNPWEKEGGTHDDDGTPEEADKIAFYYGGKGVHLRDVRFEKMEGAVCASCSCPRGDWVHAFVPPGEVRRAEELGWEVSEQGTASATP